MSVPTLKNPKAGLVALGLLASTVLISASAYGQDGDSGFNRGFYVGVGAGLSESTDSTPSSGNQYDFGNGYNILGAIGYRWTPNLRTELELDYRHAHMDSISGIGANGAQKMLSFSGNVLYDFNNSSRFTPYVGGGIGVARARWDNVNTGPGTPNINDEDNRFQWQLIGGVSLPVAQRTALFAEYRYIGVSNATFHGTAGQVVSDHYDHSHNVLGGVRFFF